MSKKLTPAEIFAKLSNFPIIHQIDLLKAAQKHNAAASAWEDTIALAEAGLSMSLLRQQAKAEAKAAITKTITAKTKAKAIAKSIIGLGRNLDLKVVAEGVEDRHTLDLLRSWDCEMAQGYHVARPMPAEVLGGWLKAWEEKLLTHTFD